jgi:ATP-dependent protease ClpP protease subunit
MAGEGKVEAVTAVPAKPKTVYIKFFAGVGQQSVNALMQVIDQKLREGVSRFVILISSPGGTVFHGLSAHNFLKGVPAEVVTHNFGTVDSIAAVVFCAGSKRYSVPHARFLLHGVSTNFQQCSLEEKQLEERLKGLRSDLENIAGVIAAATKRSERDISTQWSTDYTQPGRGCQFGLIHEIKKSWLKRGRNSFPFTNRTRNSRADTARPRS